MAAGLEVLLKRTYDAASSAKSFACGQSWEWTRQQMSNTGNEFARSIVSNDGPYGESDCKLTAN